MRNAIITLLLFLSMDKLCAQNSPILEWARAMGGVEEDAGTAMAVDPAGNVYTTGYFHGISDFDPGAGVFNLTSTGWSDIFICKLDANGNFVWAKSIGNFQFDKGLGISTDAAGNVYVTGHFRGTVDFDPGPGIMDLTATGFGDDFFILKLDTGGNLAWARNMGTVSDEYSYTINVDANGNVYTSGHFKGTVDFDPGGGVTNLTSVGVGVLYDIFVSKLDAGGNFGWVRQLGSANPFYGFFYNQCSIAFDVSGNVFIAGVFLGTGDFNPG
ncbi:MAG: hypothetical protein H7Y01_05850, partial [Ferruginibacter sp.]|nr:hypothetical protein [Chitinophagaceae bacterium]